MLTPREIAEAILDGRPVPDTIPVPADELERQWEAAQRRGAMRLVRCEWCPRQFLVPASDKTTRCDRHR